jgi:hypothetical protein
MKKLFRFLFKTNIGAYVFLMIIFITGYFLLNLLFSLLMSHSFFYYGYVFLFILMAICVLLFMPVYFSSVELFNIYVGKKDTYGFKLINLIIEDYQTFERSLFGITYDDKNNEIVIDIIWWQIKITLRWDR